MMMMMMMLMMIWKMARSDDAADADDCANSLTGRAGGYKHMG
jgi:hypothetical protein